MKQYQDHQHKISSKGRLKNRLQEIQVKKGQCISKLMFPTEMFEEILHLLLQNRYKIEEIDENTSEIGMTKNFLHNVTPFILNAFIKYLQPNPQHKEMLENIQNFKRQKESKQQKFELGDLRYLLIQEKSHVRAFKQAFQTFLKSSFLQEYIQNNQKIRNQEKKQLYLKSIQLCLEEIEKEQQIFVNFISDTNEKKKVKYSKLIMQNQITVNNNSISPVKSVSNEQDQTHNLDLELKENVSQSSYSNKAQSQVEFDQDPHFKIIPNHFYEMTMMTSLPATQVGMLIPSNFFDENYSLLIQLIYLLKIIEQGLQTLFFLKIRKIILQNLVNKKIQNKELIHQILIVLRFKRLCLQSQPL